MSAGLEEAVRAAVEAIRSARAICAFSGAGISVESGIDDFRSPGGLWSRFDPMEFATLRTFLSDPGKSWRLFRELGRSLRGKQPNDAHRALASLEQAGRLDGVITQNIDGLHQAAGSGRVIEIHGSHDTLQCLSCGRREILEMDDIDPDSVPCCENCGYALKPDVVLFEEPVREMEVARRLALRCDLMLVCGTSVEVAPASLLPACTLENGGSLIELNVTPTDLSSRSLGPRGVSVFGPIGTTLPRIVEGLLRRQPIH